VTWPRSPAPPLRARLSAALLIASALSVPSCRRAGTPGGEAGGDCADVETLRVCWQAGGPRVVTRPGPTPATDWRCAGAGATRRCTRRTDDAPAFTCAGNHCQQRHPRAPDDGEWLCADSAGAMVCVGGERAAGVAPAPADPGWLCGARRGGAPGARVCVDLSPDFPDGRARGWVCHTEYESPIRRICDRDPKAHTLAEACDAAHPCVDGSRCADGWCVPERPAPACWLEADCGGGRCRFGSCLPEGA